MHARLTRLSTLATAALTAGLLTAAPAAHAAPAPADSGPTAAREAVVCRALVNGVDARRRVVAQDFTDGRITSRRVTKPLAFNPTALGFVSSAATSTGYTMRLSAVVADGTPRLLTVRKGTSTTTLTATSSRLDQQNFRPRLFADTDGFHAYVVTPAGLLQRWSLTKFSDGTLRYAAPVRVATGYAGLRTLASFTTIVRNNVRVEILYGTTAGGSLWRIAVPESQPSRSTRTVVARTGYAGTTDLSLGLCGSDVANHLLIAVHASRGTATWARFTRAFTASERLVQRGAVTRGADWNLHAVM